MLTRLVCAIGIFSALSIGNADLLKTPAPYDLDELYRMTKQACPAADLPCFEREFAAITARNGPRAAIELFTLLQSRRDIRASIDGHHIAHHLGHETVMAFGATAEALALCPDSYNYGCMHGFFQHALGMGLLSAQGAAKICDDLQGPAFPSKTWQSCYHGFGHGEMMFAAYDLHKALDACDNLISPYAQEACRQGVFMENTDAALEGDWQKGSFSREDPLAPCDQLDSKRRLQCYFNQSGWLMRFYRNNVAEAAEACLKASADSVATCMQAIGLLTTSKAWQARLLGQDRLSGPFFKNAWTLCQRFPEGHVDECVLAGLDNLMNTATVDDAKAFCDAVDEKERQLCTQRISDDLRYLTAKNPKPDALPHQQIP